MANTFRVVTFAAAPNSAGTPYTIYTVPSSTTTVVIGLILSNIHTAQVTTEVELVSTVKSPVTVASPLNVPFVAVNALLLG